MSLDVQRLALAVISYIKNVFYIKDNHSCICLIENSGVLVGRATLIEADFAIDPEVPFDEAKALSPLYFKHTDLLPTP